MEETNIQITSAELLHYYSRKAESLYKREFEFEKKHSGTPCERCGGSTKKIYIVRGDLLYCYNCMEDYGDYIFGLKNFCDSQRIEYYEGFETPSIRFNFHLN